MSDTFEIHGTQSGRMSGPPPRLTEVPNSKIKMSKTNYPRTKAGVKAFVHAQGFRANYSGNTKTMFLHADIPLTKKARQARLDKLEASILDNFGMGLRFELNGKIQ